MAREIWRLLGPGEEKKRTDQFIDLTCQGSRWCGLDGPFFSEYQVSDCIYRRRETIEDETKWVSVDNPPNNGIGDVLVCYENGAMNVLQRSYVAMKSSSGTHWSELPKPPPKSSDSFETFWQTHKEKLVDTSKDAVKLIYEEARKL